MGREYFKLPADLPLDTSYHGSICKGSTSSDEAIAVYHLSAI
jgi:hypothetical protein